MPRIAIPLQYKPPKASARTCQTVTCAYSVSKQIKMQQYSKLGEGLSLETSLNFQEHDSCNENLIHLMRRNVRNYCRWKIKASGCDRIELWGVSNRKYQYGQVHGRESCFFFWNQSSSVSSFVRNTGEQKISWSQIQREFGACAQFSNQAMHNECKIFIPWNINYQNWKQILTRCL